MQRLIIALIVAVSVGCASVHPGDHTELNRTIADMRSIAAAVEAYASDHRRFPTAATIIELEPLLQPKYIKGFPRVDG